MVAGSDVIPGASDKYAGLFVEYNSAGSLVTFADDPAGADLILFFEENSLKLRGHSKWLETNTFITDYLGKLYTINYDAVARRYIPGLYTALKKSWSQDVLYRPTVYPKTINEIVDNAAEEDRTRPPELLFSFRGERAKTAVRAEIFEHYEGRHEQWHVADSQYHIHAHTVESQQTYLDEILSSSFVLCPRGLSPSTYRLYEVMSLGRCGVIISDEWLPPAGEINWDSCTVRIEENRVKDIASILKDHGPAVAAEKGRLARKVWEDFFAEDVKYRNYLQHLLEMHRNRPPGCDKDYFLRRWRSREFYRENRWLLPQRIMNRLNSLFRAGV